MELIVITPGKLKIMLTPDDMVKYELEDVKECEHVRAGKALRRICEDARAAIGFDTEGERLFVQFYASREGGGELFVTKLGRAEASGRSFPRHENFRDGEKKLLDRIHALSDVKTRCPAQFGLCFRFVDLRDLTLACKALLLQGFTGVSNAYISEEPSSDWYLTVSSQSNDETSLSRAAVLLGEFGTAISEPWATLFIPEHARLLCGFCAVQIFSRY